MTFREESAEKTPYFSIIVPVYKTEQYLSQCVDSILTQSFQDFEVILVDDGSPDKSGDICDQYACQDRRVHVIHKKNGGLVSARKAGLAVCKGEYVLNVDSDDYIGSDLLKRLVKIITTNNPQAILFNLLQFSENSTTELRNLVDSGLYDGTGMKSITDNLIQNEKGEQVILYNLCGMAVRREEYSKYQNMVPNTISRGEDLVVTTPLLLSCDRVYVADYFGYYYRSNPASIMNTFSIKEIDQIKQVVRYLASYFKGQLENKLDVYVAMHYFDFIDRGMSRGKYLDYRRLINETLDDEVDGHIKKACCKRNLKVKVILMLLRNHMFSVLWFLRKIKR